MGFLPGETQLHVFHNHCPLFIITMSRLFIFQHFTHRFQGEVIPKPTVTTGVVWRAARFEKLSQETWFPWGTKKDGVHTCDFRASHSGYETIRVTLHDELAQKKVALAMETLSASMKSSTVALNAQTRSMNLALNAIAVQIGNSLFARPTKSP